MQKMQKMQSKLTSQGQVSVPAPVRSFLNLMPGSMLVWTQEGDRIVVDRAKRHTTQEVHQALFPQAEQVPVAPKTLAELKQGLRAQVRRRHVGR